MFDHAIVFNADTRWDTRSLTNSYRMELPPSSCLDEDGTLSTSAAVTAAAIAAAIATTITSVTAAVSVTAAIATTITSATAISSSIELDFDRATRASGFAPNFMDWSRSIGLGINGYVFIFP